MKKNELLRKMGFSEGHIQKLDDFSEQAVNISPSSYSNGIIHHTSSDSNELILNHGNEDADSEFKITM